MKGAHGSEADVGFWDRARTARVHVGHMIFFYFKC
jgi:hypothetical protein